MAVRIIAEVSRHYRIAPVRLWREHTHGQLMIMWREARESEAREFGTVASIMRAATAAAIVNTMVGKEVREFDEMVADLLGGDREKAGSLETADQLAAAGLSHVPPDDPDNPVDRWETY